MPDRSCDHLSRAVEGIAASDEGCHECLAAGGRWVHLRMCMVCGHVGCCDSSPGKHASRHFVETGHPVMRSVESGETWGWCYEHRRQLGPFDPVE